LARNVGAAVTVGDKVLFAGGSIDTAPYASVPSRRVDILDTGTGQWSTAELSGGSGATVATVIGNTAIFVAGHQRTNAIADIYDGVTGKWSTAPLSISRSPDVAVSVGKYVLLAGDSISQHPTSKSSRAVDVYNSATGKWSNAHLSQGRNHLSAVVVGELALFAGGQYIDRNNNPGYSDVVDIFDSRTGRWSRSTIPNGAFVGAATSLGAEAIFATDNGTYVFDTRTRRWFKGGLTSFSSNSQVAVTVDGKALFVSEGTGVIIYGSNADILAPTALVPPARPRPVDGAHVTVRHFRFSWTPVANATTYDNFVGGALAATVSSNGYTPTEYFDTNPGTWQILAHVGDSLLAGPVWNFTVD
jgi:hypothetical protein